MTYHEERRLIEHDVPNVVADIGVDDIIWAIRVVAVFNHPRNELAKAFLETFPDGIKARGKVRDALSAGGGVFDALTRECPKLADCIHDFVYEIVYPLSSITTRDLAREQVARLILSL